MKIMILSREDKTVRQLRSVFQTYEKHKYYEIEVVVYGRLKDYLLSNDNPDMVFIEDNFEMKPAMDTARIVRARDSRTALVIISGNADRVFDAFPVKAHRFLLKPVTQAEIFEAIDAYRKDFISYRIIIAKIEDTFRVFSSEEIYAVVGDGATAQLMTRDSILDLQTPYLQMESQLPEEYFFKCHRSYIVNMKHIASFTPDELTMKNKQMIPISRRRKLDFFVRYSEFIKGHTFSD